MIDKFLQFEKEYNLLNKSFLGFNYWGYIRTKIYHKLFDETEENTSKKQTKGSSSKLASIIDKNSSSNVMSLLNNKVRFIDVIYLLRNMTIKHPLLYRKKHKFLLFPSTRRTLLNGKFFAYWTDELADELGEECLNAESLDGTRHMRPYYNKRLLEIDVVDVNPVLFSGFSSFFHKKQTKSLKIIAENLEKIINNYFGKNIDILFLETLLIKRFFWWKSKRKFFCKLLKNISPKIIIEIASYDTNNMVLNEIARELGIVSIELQHGVIGTGHIGYNYLTEKREHYMPDYLFTFSDFWKDNCRFPIGENKIKAVGYPFFENQLKLYPKQKTNVDDIVIVFLSQPLYQNVIHAFCLDLVKYIANIKSNIKIYYKLHPSEYSQPSEKWQDLVEEGCILVNDNRIPLYSLFAKSDIQIGVNSTSLFEGLAYDLKTFIINTSDSKERMADLIDNDYAILCNTAKDVMPHLGKKNISGKKCDDNVFFKKNGIKNILSEISNILGEDNEQLK